MRGFGMLNKKPNQLWMLVSRGLIGAATFCLIMIAVTAAMWLAEHALDLVVVAVVLLICYPIGCSVVELLKGAKELVEERPAPPAVPTEQVNPPAE
jgi:hypothetical protein